MVQLLREHGAEIEWRLNTRTNSTSFSVLSAVVQYDIDDAVNARRLAVAEMLLKQGADPNWLNQDGDGSLLNAAALFGNLAVAKLLLEHGAKLEDNDNRGWTPLFSAVYNNHPPMVKLLVDHGANVNAQDHAGNTPLHPFPQLTLDPAIGDYLIAHGAK
jgi:ankyrin repeat protein